VFAGWLLAKGFETGQAGLQPTPATRVAAAA
jgi:hypothetical protein